MLLKSKFSKLSKARYIFFIPICLFAVLLFGISCFNEDYEMRQRSLMFLLAIFALGLLITFVMDIYSLFRVQLDEEKITVINIINNKQEFYYYKDIVKAKSINNKTFLFRQVPVTDGYHSLIYTMTDGRVLELSPDVYQNFDELVNIIREYNPHLEQLKSAIQSLNKRH